jgi:hypothetical protein
MGEAPLARRPRPAASDTGLVSGQQHAVMSGNVKEPCGKVVNFPLLPLSPLPPTAPPSLPHADATEGTERAPISQVSEQRAVDGKGWKKSETSTIILILMIIKIQYPLQKNGKKLKD